MDATPLFGALVGDALGVPFEFKPPEDIPRREAIEMQMPADFPKTYGRIPYGTWSDDGAQTLCLTQVLVEGGRVDEFRFADLLLQWRDAALHQSGGVVFDCGGQTAAALRRISSGGPVLARTGERSNGNGSLMRNLPVGLFGARCGWTDAEIVAAAQRQSMVTHGHPLSTTTCARHALLVGLLARAPGIPFMDALRESGQRLLAVHAGSDGHDADADDLLRAAEAIDRFAAQEFRRGSGFVLDTFWSAIEAVNKTDDYAGAVRYAVALGNDTDTTACVAGGLATLRWGPASIPANWLSLLRTPIESATVLNAWMAR